MALQQPPMDGKTFESILGSLCHNLTELWPTPKIFFLHLINCWAVICYSFSGCRIPDSLLHFSIIMIQNPFDEGKTYFSIWNCWAVLCYRFSGQRISVLCPVFYGSRLPIRDSNWTRFLKNKMLLSSNKGARRFPANRRRGARRRLWSTVELTSAISSSATPQISQGEGHW